MRAPELRAASRATNPVTHAVGMPCGLGIFGLLWLGATVAPKLSAQEPHAGHDSTLSSPDRPAHEMEGMTGPLGIPASRDGSGTAWLPDSTSMHAFHGALGSWRLMRHGNAFLEYISEGGTRGDRQLGSINWIMGMAERTLAGGEFAVRGMMSAEPFTVGSCGYPDLLATGESCRGEPLHDRQHPHDLFMEVAVLYHRALGSGFGVQLYGGPAGEPAIGPVAYPHRISALPNLVAPIGHHWLDATHITFGLVTVGVFGRKWKLEGSLFNGREPDENRYDFDFQPLDSYSARLWVLPSPRWALQVSAARLVEVEPGTGGLPPGNQTRVTASLNYHATLAGRGVWASTAIWGRNIEHGRPTDALLVETVLSLPRIGDLFLRAETVAKPGEDLVPETPGLAEAVFHTASVAAGYVYRFGPAAGVMPGVGMRAGLSFIPRTLEGFYGSRVIGGLALFINLLPAPMGRNSTSGAGPH